METILVHEVLVWTEGRAVNTRDLMTPSPPLPNLFEMIC